MPLFSSIRTLSAVALLCTLAVTSVSAQTTGERDDTAPDQSLTPDDYGKWERLGSGTLSPNGQWLAYSIRRVNEENEIRLRLLNADSLFVAPYGSRATFSDDSHWLAYAIGMPEKKRKKLDKQKKPIRNKLGLLNLVTGDSTEVEEVASFSFSDDGAYLAMRRYPLKEKESKGVDLVVQTLATGIEVNFGNVAEYAWQEEGTLLAMVIDAEGKAGNGVQVFNPDTGVLRILDSTPNHYTGLSWRKEHDDLAVLREHEDEQYEEATHIMLAWRSLADETPEKSIFDPSSVDEFPADTRIVDAARLQWAEDGATIFFGIKDRTRKPEEETAEADSTATNQGDEEEPAEVQIWHAKDVQVIPEQKRRADRIRRRHLLAAWHLDGDRFVQLGKDLTEPVSIIKGQPLAISTDRTPYEFDSMFGRGYQDLYLIDVTTGNWTQIQEKVPYHFGASPGGRYLLYVKDEHYWVYDHQTKQHTNITADVPTSFVDQDNDHPVAEKYPIGRAGWTQNDEAVLLYDKYDIWEVNPDGAEAVNLTQGAADKIRHHYVRLDPDEEFIDSTKPLYVSRYGEWSKKYGYTRLQAGQQPEHLVWQDDNVGRLTKAEKAEVYAYVVQDFDDSPDYFVSGSDFSKARPVTETNPFQKEYAWGRSELIEYENPWGRPLQGALFYPANYEPGKKYPMIVYIYEIRSHAVHQYSVPSERSYYNTSVFTSQDYFVLQPDIVFQKRDPGMSSVKTIEAAISKVLETDMVDPERVGLVGHSWGGYQTAFAVTQTDMLAAAVAGAPLTNLISMYGAIFWNSGAPETGHFEVGQERMEVPYWEDPEAYLRNSPVFGVDQIKTPLLVEVGDADGNVDWRQGIEYYNAARRAGKNFVLLAYEGENHGLAKKHNQIDYHRRILTWFGHYLKGEPAPTWMTEGIPWDEQEKARKHKE